MQRHLIDLVPCRTVEIGAGQLELWNTPDGRVLIHLQPAHETPIWIELSPDQAVWLARELLRNG